MHGWGCGGEAPEKLWGNVGTYSHVNSGSSENELQRSSSVDFEFRARKDLFQFVASALKSSSTQGRSLERPTYIGTSKSLQHQLLHMHGSFVSRSAVPRGLCFPSTFFEWATSSPVLSTIAISVHAGSASAAFRVPSCDHSTVCESRTKYLLHSHCLTPHIRNLSLVANTTFRLNSCQFLMMHFDTHVTTQHFKL